MLWPQEVPLSESARSSRIAVFELAVLKYTKRKRQCWVARWLSDWNSWASGQEEPLEGQEGLMVILDEEGCELDNTVIAVLMLILGI